jgi:hypothetical protein
VSAIVMSKPLFTTGVLLGFVLTTVAAGAQSYTAIDIGVLPGQTSSFAIDVNNQRQVVGHSGGEAFLWDPVGGLRPLGVQGTSLRINNSGTIAGIRFDAENRPHLFAVAGGVTFDLPGPPGETFLGISELTDDNNLLVCGSRCWALYGGAYYDLEALTGARIGDFNDAAMLGGSIDGDAYVRFPDGRVVVRPWPVINPWMGFDRTSAVEVVGAGGHFAGRGGADAWYGLPDGRTFLMGIRAGVRTQFSLRDINRSGDVVGTYRFVTLLPMLDAGFVLAGGRLVNLRESTVTGPSEIREAAAINDAGDIAATAYVDGAARAVLLTQAVPTPPANLAFSVSGSIVSLTWMPVPDVVEYIVEAGSAAGLRDLHNAAVGLEPGLVTPAPPGRYYVRVRARNASGVSAPSNEVVIDVR